MLEIWYTSISNCVLYTNIMWPIVDFAYPKLALVYQENMVILTLIKEGHVFHFDVSFQTLVLTGPH